MTDIFNVQSTVGGLATNTASAAATLPPIASLASPQNGRILRIVTDSYVRIAFGGNTIQATSSSTLFAPGEVYISISLANTYYSALAPGSTANFSISAGNPINFSSLGS